MAYVIIWDYVDMYSTPDVYLCGKDEEALKKLLELYDERCTFSCGYCNDNMVDALKYAKEHGSDKFAGTHNGPRGIVYYV